jgi:hypothetical protein
VISTARPVGGFDAAGVAVAGDVADAPEFALDLPQPVRPTAAVRAVRYWNEGRNCGAHEGIAVYNERNGTTLDHTLSTALIGPDRRVIELWRGNGWRTEEVLKAVAEQNAKFPVAACCHSSKS